MSGSPLRHEIMSAHLVRDGVFPVITLFLSLLSIPALCSPCESPRHVSLPGRNALYPGREFSSAAFVYTASSFSSSSFSYSV